MGGDPSLAGGFADLGAVRWWACGSAKMRRCRRLASSHGRPSLGRQPAGRVFVADTVYQGAAVRGADASVAGDRPGARSPAGAWRGEGRRSGRAERGRLGRRMACGVRRSGAGGVPDPQLDQGMRDGERRATGMPGRRHRSGGDRSAVHRLVSVRARPALGRRRRLRRGCVRTRGRDTSVVDRTDDRPLVPGRSDRRLDTTRSQRSPVRSSPGPWLPDGSGTRPAFPPSFAPRPHGRRTSGRATSRRTRWSGTLGLAQRFGQPGRSSIASRAFSRLSQMIM